MKSPRASKIKSRAPSRDTGKRNEGRNRAVRGQKTPSVAKSSTSIGAIIRAIAGEVPVKEWQKVPVDLSYQHDHYLYGSPKR
jgi:hypothetical protein